MASQLAVHCRGILRCRHWLVFSEAWKQGCAVGVSLLCASWRLARRSHPRVASAPEAWSWGLQLLPNRASLVHPHHQRSLSVSDAAQRLVHTRRLVTKVRAGYAEATPTRQRLTWRCGSTTAVLDLEPQPMLMASAESRRRQLVHYSMRSTPQSSRALAPCRAFRDEHNI